MAPNPIQLSVIPWFHAYGCLTIIGSLINFEKIVFLEKFEDKPFLTAIEVISQIFIEKSITTIFYVYRNIG